MKIQLPTPEGLRAVELRFPTDEEWIDRNRRQKLITKQISRTVTEDTIVETPETDLLLVEKLREVHEGPPLSTGEASWILDQLSSAEVEEVERQGAQFRIVLRVPGGLVTHIVGMPSVEDMQDFQREFTSTRQIQEGRLVKQEQVVNLAAVKKLYQKLSRGTEGYGMAVPVVHQLPVVLEVMREVRRPISENGTGNF